MRVLVTPTMLSIKVGSLSEAESTFISAYVSDDVEVKYSYANFGCGSLCWQVKGKPEHLYKFLLDACYTFDVELV